MRTSRPLRGGRPGHAVGGRPLDPAALSALLRASHLLGLALGSALGRLRESGATAARLFERAEESALLLRMMREAAGILGARWDKVPERHRPHYAPVRRFADVVRAVVKTMELAGFGGDDLIARTQARAGWKLSARTVGRIRSERWPPPRMPEAASSVPRAVRVRHPNHVWMVDLTDVRGLFSLVTFKVGVVFDAFSRMPLSARVFMKEPSSAEIARFVSRAAGRRGRPSKFVSDQGRQDLFGIEEELDRADRTPVEDAEGHARPAPVAAVGGGGSDGEDPVGPRSLRALPLASGPRRCDAGGHLLREDAVAPFRNPAFARQVG